MENANQPNNITIVQRDCPSCKTNNDNVSSSRFSCDDWLIKNCQNCGFVYIDSAPDYVQLFEKMAWEKTTKFEEFRRKEVRPLSYKASKLTRWRMRLTIRNKQENIVAANARVGNVMDLGCGDGYLLSRFSEDFKLFGIEISTKISKSAEIKLKDRRGTIVNDSSLNGLKKFPDEFFTAVIMRSYLEHELNPHEVLIETHRSLQKGGIAVVKVPNYGSINRVLMGKRWCGFRYPDHLNYFTPKSLRKMAEQVGFSVRFGILGKLPTSDNMHAILTRR